MRPVGDVFIWRERKIVKRVMNPAAMQAAYNMTAVAFADEDFAASAKPNKSGSSERVLWYPPFPDSRFAAFNVMLFKLP